jgi:chromosome partitioning protein
VLPSSKGLAGAGVEMIGLENREFLLKGVLDQVRERYDFIFIDCPPSLELLTLNGLCAADTLLVPVQGEYFALEGLSDLMTTVRLVKRNLNSALELEGVLLTMYDSRTNLSLQVAEEVKRYFPGKVYTAVVPRNVRLSEAPSHGRPISAYDRTSRGAEAYRQLAEEFLRKNGIPAS